MNLTLGSLTALRVTRAVRCGFINADLKAHCAMQLPNPEPQKRWSRGLLSEGLAFLGPFASFSDDRPLHVIVPRKSMRIQMGSVQNTIASAPLPEDVFADLGSGVAMSCPELLFAELGSVMDPVIHLLVGMELCGRFSRSPENPRNGRVAYGIEPVTTAARLRSFAETAKGIRGARQAVEVADLIAENAWSPMEAIVAALAVLPPEQLGLGLGPVALNPRRELGERLSRLSDASSRVPDIMFTGTNVGLNYDGEDHFRLEEIARAAIALDRDPGNVEKEREYREALSDVRSRIVADKRRDRDLMSLGLTVFSTTKEDLLEQDGFEHVMGQVLEAIERTERRDLSAQRLLLENERLSQARFDLIRSLTPGAFSGGMGVTMDSLRMAMDNAVVRFEVGADGPKIVSTVRD